MTMRKLYFALSEHHGILNSHERGFRSLEKAQELAAKTAEECSWECLTPPAPDNEVSRGKGNFRCGVMAAHGIVIRAMEEGIWTGVYDVPDEQFRQTKAGPHVDWALEVIIDRGTDYLADGADTLYFTGPEPTDMGWYMIVEDVADGGKIVEATVRPTPHGRYYHMINEAPYPMKWDRGF